MTSMDGLRTHDWWPRLDSTQNILLLLLSSLLLLLLLLLLLVLLLYAIIDVVT